MNKITNRFLIILFLALAILFFYFGSGTTPDIGMMHENNWIHSRGWGSFPALFTLVLVILVGWLAFSKKTK
jgi:hypothetical protein